MNKARPCTSTMMPGLLIVSMFISVSCTSSKSEPPAQTQAQTQAPTVERDRAALVQPGVPGGIVVQTHRITANVTAVDRKKRTVTLVGPDGIKQTIKCGPEVVNFDQIQVGQQLKAEVTEQVAVYMASETPAVQEGAVTLVAVPPKGGKPAALAANTSQVVATVSSIDAANRKATLSFPDGSTKIVKVRDDIDLAQRKVGEQVVIRVTEAVAIAVDEP